MSDKNYSVRAKCPDCKDEKIIEIPFGYPMSVVKVYKQNSKWYREEVKDYTKAKAIQSNRQRDNLS